MRYERWVQHNLIHEEDLFQLFGSSRGRRRLRKPLLYPPSYGGSRGG